MNFLNALTIKKRIQLLITIPVIALLVLIGRYFVNSLSDYRNMNEMVTSLNYVNHIVPVLSDLIAEQEETSNYIYSSDSAASSAKQGMLNARNKTDADMNALNKFFEENHDVMVAVFQNEKHFSELKTKLNTLNYIRKVADAKQPSSDDYKDVFGGHTIWAGVDISRLAEAVSNTVSYATAFASHDPDVVNEANAYYWLLKAQIATLNLHNNINEAVNKGVSGYLFGQIMHFRGLEGEFRSAFESYASEDLIAIFNKNMKDTGVLDRVVGCYWTAFDSYQLIVPQGEEQKKLPLADWSSISQSTKVAYENTTNAVLKELLALGNSKADSAKYSLVFAIVISIILIAVILVISTLVMTSITSALHRSQHLMEKLAKEKDMTLHLNAEGHNELSLMAKAFNSLVKSFNEALVAVQDQVNLASKSVEEGVDKMNQTKQSCEEQQSSTDTISAAMHQMSTNIGEVSKIAQDAANGVKTAHDYSISSEASWNECRESLENLTVGLKDASESVLELNKETERIVDILDIIQGIAEQTNLLALNAAIEAARAGESGKGFAVVADEVRNLAMKSKDSTEQIRAQIDKLVLGANHANQNMEILQRDGKKSVDMVITSADAFTQIRSELDKITDLTNVLASSAEEQASVSTHITERITYIKDASNEIHDSATNTVDTLNHLQAEFTNLEDIVNLFKVERS